MDDVAQTFDRGLKASRQRCASCVKQWLVIDVNIVIFTELNSNGKMHW